MDHFEIMGMADQGQLPKLLARRSKYATPTIPILLAAAWILILANADFEALVELVNILVILRRQHATSPTRKLRWSQMALPIPLTTSPHCFH